MRGFLDTLEASSRRLSARRFRDDALGNMNPKFRFILVDQEPRPTPSSSSEEPTFCSQAVHWSSASIILWTRSAISRACDAELSMRTFACRCIRRVTELSRDTDVLVGHDDCGLARSLEVDGAEDGSMSEAWRHRFCWSMASARSPIAHGGGGVVCLATRVNGSLRDLGEKSDASCCLPFSSSLSLLDAKENSPNSVVAMRAADPPEEDFGGLVRSRVTWRHGSSYAD
ncbi:hypothetical protein DM02DRAFT_719 [Periconia macrospinosa]|uniref:Uncharacterized protein n=1 Tax=Periconia macrospinosa TaxID=97972 RepID=A0A2V1ECN3_9PLEO|nr:hypothetical protein DM02DRAFT_719 [Periconia macrospinosa]